MRRSLCLFILLSAILAVNAYAIEELGNTLNEDLVKRQVNPGVPDPDAEVAGENETGEDPTNAGDETPAGEGETPAEELPPAVPVEEPKPAEANKPEPAKQPKPAEKPQEVPAGEASPEDANQEADIPGEVPNQDDTLVGEENAGIDTDPDVGAPVNPAPSKPHKPVHNASTAPNQHPKPVRNSAHRGVRRQPVRRGQNQRGQPQHKGRPQHKVSPRQNRQQNRRPNKVQNRRPTTVRRVANNRKRVNQNRRPAQRNNNSRRRLGK